ncbi:hypothetical protein ACQ4PT_022674 [Festuca glaucescens]
MWSIWTAHNGRRHGSVPLELSRACKWARDTANDLVLSTKKPTDRQAHPKRSHWLPPPSNSIKINSDATFDANTFSGSTGYVIRDDKGLFIAAGAKWYGALGNALSAEALACRDGLILAQHLQAANVHLETDCEVLIELWKTRKKNRAAIWPVLNEIQELMGYFSSFSFCHVKRKANLVAHVTAKQASPSQPMSSWLDEAPAFVNPCIQHDYAVIREI